MNLIILLFATTCIVALQKDDKMSNKYTRILFVNINLQLKINKIMMQKEMICNSTLTN